MTESSELASGTDHKLSNSSLKIKFSRKVLWRETLVVVVVSADYDFSFRGIKRIPKRLHSATTLFPSIDRENASHFNSGNSTCTPTTTDF
jgi:hypothetical protein